MKVAIIKKSSQSALIDIRVDLNNGF